LLQVKNEPRDRCYIGPQPETIAALRKHARPWIKSVSIDKEGADLTEKWFDGVKLPFNPELVAIIGKKGSGKSAIADILAVLGGARVNEADFGFLNRERFRRPDASSRVERSSHFKATVEWSNHEVVSRLLSEPVHETELERVRYLPQGYLEKICNHRTTEAYLQFESELDRVIFSHVPVSDRLEKDSLAELIDDQAAELKRAISRLKSEIRALNVQIVSAEQRLSEMARRALVEQIGSIEKQLGALDAEPLEVVAEPTKDLTVLQATAERLARMQRFERERTEVIGQVTRAEGQQRSTQLQLATSMKLRERLREILNFAETSKAAVAELALALGLPAADLFSFSVDASPVDKLVLQLKATVVQTQVLLDSKSKQSLVSRERELAEAIVTEQNGLDEPNRRYQKYLADVVSRSARRAEIIGDSATAGTLEFYRAQLRTTIDSLPRELADLQKARAERTLQIHALTEEIASVYKRYYERIQQFIDDRDVWKGRIDLRFDVTIRPEKFTERFFSMVTQNVAGSFCGIEEGVQRLSETLDQHNFTDATSTLAFVENIVQQLNRDYRYEHRPRTTLDRQLRKGVERKQLLDSLYSIEFLVPKYELKLDGRTLQELSPGERGLLLLVFYLVIDEDRSPLILDQPEENLDNQSIKDALVPCIQYAKRRRQMFIVTHNPNLAVVCDAEQIVVSHIDKADENAITYVSGGIESIALNRQVVDVLEGTPPAFENRSDKYETAGSLLWRGVVEESGVRLTAGLRPAVRTAASKEFIPES
jgi:ABC-type lipoprotein export system ATPase subunit